MTLHRDCCNSPLHPKILPDVCVCACTDLVHSHSLVRVDRPARRGVVDALRVKAGVYLGAIDTLLQLLRVDAVLACRPVRGVAMSIVSTCDVNINGGMCMYMYRFARAVSVCARTTRVRRAQTTMMTTKAMVTTTIGAMTTDDSQSFAQRALAMIATTTAK